MMRCAEGLRGLKATIVGAAREGTVLARYLVACGSIVTLTDNKPAAALRYLSEVEDLDLRLVLEEPPDLSGVDVLFISPGVPPYAPIVREARRRGVPISSEPRLFTQTCQVPVVGITGSSGKTTTVALTDRMYVAGGKSTWVGGNIGTPLIGKLLEGTFPDVAVMELSSFQLELFSPEYQGASVEEQRSQASRAISLEGWSPHIAAVTNVTPNHLDRHPSMGEYTRAKSNIWAFQGADDWAVLNLDNALSHGMTARVCGHVLHFSLIEPVQQGAFVKGSEIVLRFDGREQLLCQTEEIKLRGRHNVTNVLAAACCALAGGLDSEAMHAVARTFSGMPHRLEAVRNWHGVLYVNDSIATSPERAIAALRSFHEPLVLLAGGRDKHLPWDDWADLVLERVKAVVAFGEAVPIIETALSEARQRKSEVSGDVPPLCCVDSLEGAIAVASRSAKSGDVVLLSPGGTSFDAFEDFEARGRRFRELVAALPEGGAI